jgi:hypothetical protein
MPPPYTFAPLESRPLNDDAALQLVNVLFEMVSLLLLTVVTPETVLLLLLYEYAPTATDMPPPYTFAPKELRLSRPLTDLNDDAALQLVNVLFEMV